MWKVKHKKSTKMIGQMGQCWIWLRDKYGHVPAKDLMDMGWSIEKARK